MTQRQLGWSEAVAAVGPERGPGFGGHLPTRGATVQRFGCYPLSLGSAGIGGSLPAEANWRTHSANTRLAVYIGILWRVWLKAE
jgi:hypothetical protein